MKQLIESTRATIRTGIGYIKDRDVFVTEDLRLIRNSGSYPAIGIKDGGINFAFESGDQGDESLQLSFSLQVKLAKSEASIMGDDSTGSIGVLDMAKDVIALLVDTLPAGIDLALPVSVGESEILSTDNLDIVMLPVVMKFERYS
ncbi:hypothetical protein [Desulfopila inferna]|uniref:hypothetical protein n=1 Tax=Desulfopila inferna TaxID=468528 RepID=UPI0019649D36|nr:hypothetical protein [Desulfopila inferna]MBM9605967.1 hypothetical protein [Desulfopila inferna]